MVCGPLAGYAEIYDTDVGLRIDEDILGLDVRVDEAELVHVGDGVGHLQEYRDHVRHREVGAVAEHLAREILHHDVEFDGLEELADAAAAVHRDYVIVFEERGDLVLVDGLLDKALVALAGPLDHLDGVDLAVMDARAPEDGASGAGADDLEVRELFENRLQLSLSSSRPLSGQRGRRANHTRLTGGLKPLYLGC